MLSLLHVKHFSLGQITSSSVGGDVGDSVESKEISSVVCSMDNSVDGSIIIVVDIIFWQFFVSSSNEYPSLQVKHFWEVSSSECSEHVLHKR